RKRAQRSAQSGSLPSELLQEPLDQLLPLHQEVTQIMLFRPRHFASQRREVIGQEPPQHGGVRIRQDQRHTTSQAPRPPGAAEFEPQRRRSASRTPAPSPSAKAPANRGSSS